MKLTPNQTRCLALVTERNNVAHGWILTHHSAATIDSLIHKGLLEVYIRDPHSRWDDRIRVVA